MTIKLTDLQLVLLSTAAARPDGSLLPPPDSVGDQLARIRKAIPPLLKRALVAETDVADPALAWREDGERHVSAIITAAGRTTIGADDPANVARPEMCAPAPSAEESPAVPEPEIPSPARPTKAAAVLALLRRSDGATLAELVAATGWLPHTTRAALTGLRKKGHAIEKRKRGETSYYHVAEAA